MNTIHERFDGYIAPGKIAGNIYFVGTKPASTHIIDTGDGLIMIDPGYAGYLPIVIDSMWRLGFDPADVKIILITHGHIDHFAAAPMMRKISGAKVYIGEQDADCVRGITDYSWARELKIQPVTFEPDELIHDGDVIKLGNTEIHCIHTPGHSPGAHTFHWDIEHGGKKYTAIIHGGIGFNTLSADYILNNGFSLDLQRQFIEGCKKLSEFKAEIFLGNHVHNNDTAGKLARVAAGESDAFISEDGTDWKKHMLERAATLEAVIEKEKKEGKQ